MSTKSTLIFALAIIGSIPLLFATSCSVKQGSEPPAQVQPYLKKVEEGQARQQSIQAEYKAMQIPELAKRLETDSAKDVEPFNSLAYREAVSRGSSVSRELASFIKTPDRSSFLTLLVVRKTGRDIYDSVDARTKVAVLIDALRTSKNFNTWGLPHLYWEDAAKSIIELGKTAVEPLKTLLEDRRDAPVWGSEEAMEYQKYKYRVNDYAWALLMEIEGKKVDIPGDHATRDRMISEAKGSR